MKLIFKQKMFSWFDTYNVYDGYDDRIILYTIKGQLSWGHCFKIYDKNNVEVGMVKQRIFSFLPKYEIYINNNYIGCISREFSFFKPKYNIDYNGWRIDGNYFELDYQIYNSNGAEIATVFKEMLSWTDTYVLNVYDSNDVLNALMLVVAIDAEKCSRRD